MKLTSGLVSLAVAFGAVAAPLEKDIAAPLESRTLGSILPNPFTKEKKSGQASAFSPTPILLCLSSSQANKIVDGFKYLLEHPNAQNFKTTSDSLFADNYVEYSDSINIIQGTPLGSATFPNQQAFIDASTSQPALVTNTLDIFHSCNAISWRWQSVSGVGNDEKQVKGITDFYINAFGRIEEIDSEFNSGAFLANLGYPECSSQ